MTCLLISDVFPPKTGGSGRWFWEIYRRLSRQDYVIAAGQDPRQETFDATHDLRVVRTPLTMRAWGIRSLTGLRGYWRALRRLRKIIKREHVQMIHCARCLPEGVMGWALKRCYGIPYACYVHGEDVNGASTSRELTWLAGRALHNAQFVIPNSRNTERILRDEWRVPESRIRLLHPGVDTQYFVPQSRNHELRVRLGWGERPVLLTVGRLQKRKGHDQMIHALLRIRQTIPNVLYGIVGDGEEREFLHDLVRQLDLGEHVQFLGELGDGALLECYQQCDLFVLPNRQVGRDIEGFGMVLLEAQACGKPVIAGASGGTAETMSIPQTGRVVCCDGPRELADLIVELFGDPEQRARMGVAARRWVVEHFDWDALSRKAERLFRMAPEPFPAGMKGSGTFFGISTLSSGAEKGA